MIHDEARLVSQPVRVSQRGAEGISYPTRYCSKRGFAGDTRHKFTMIDFWNDLYYTFFERKLMIHSWWFQNSEILKGDSSKQYSQIEKRYAVYDPDETDDDE